VLIRPHDAATNDDEWRNLLHAHPFGTLIAPGTARELPVVVPTHVHFDGNNTIRLHLARPNPVWPALRENPRCLFVVVAAVTYVPTSWEAPTGTPPEWGIPTSHYAAVELDCTATITDDPADIRRYLADQLATRLNALVCEVAQGAMGPATAAAVGAGLEALLTRLERDRALREAAGLLCPGGTRFARAKGLEAALRRFEQAAWKRIRDGHRRPRDPVELHLGTALTADPGMPRTWRKLWDLLPE